MSDEAMATKTEQAAFDRVVHGLAAQGWQQSRGPGTNDPCMFRGPRGMKCAVGHLIDDADYKVIMLSHDVMQVVIGKQGVSLGFIDQIMCAHDGAHNGRLAMHKAFRDVAEVRGLTFPSDLLAPGTDQ